MATGYELLMGELEKRFNKSKVSSNEKFIHAIVEILAEIPDKVALELAQKKLDEANANVELARRLNNSAAYRDNEARSSLRQIERENEEAKELYAHLEDLKKKIESCETPEARDKLRLAEYFSSRCEYTDSVAYTRGLSNILGNGNLNKVPHSGDNISL